MLCMLFLGWSERNDIWIWTWADKKQHSSPQSSQIFWISKQVFFVSSFAYLKLRQYFFTSTISLRIQQLHLVLVERFPTHWRLSVQSLLPQNLISAEKESRSHLFFLMVKPEVKTWMCHLQDLDINGSSMKVPPFFQPWAAPNSCGKILNPGKDLIRGPGIPSGFGTPFLSHRFSCGSKLFEHVWTFIPPKTNPSWCHFIMAIGLTFKGIAKCKFSIVFTFPTRIRSTGFSPLGN